VKPNAPTAWNGAAVGASPERRTVDRPPAGAIAHTNAPSRPGTGTGTRATRLAVDASATPSRGLASRSGRALMSSSGQKRVGAPSAGAKSGVVAPPSLATAV